MTHWILFALAGLALALAMHPFVTYPLSLGLLKKLWPHRAKPLPARRRNIDFTICMCAFIEEGVIRGGMVPKIRAALAALSWEGAEAVIADSSAPGALGRALDDATFGTRITARAEVAA